MTSPLLTILQDASEIGIVEAFAALWPILLAVSAGYGALFAYIRSQQTRLEGLYDKRIGDKEAEIERLEEQLKEVKGERDTFRDMAFDAVSGLKSTTNVIEQTVPRNVPPTRRGY